MISLVCSLAGMTFTVTKERYVEMLQKIFCEDSPDISFRMEHEDCFPEKPISLKSELILSYDHQI